MTLEDFPHYFETDSETKMAYLTISTTCGPIVFAAPLTNQTVLKHMANNRIAQLRLRPEGYHDNA